MHGIINAFIAFTASWTESAVKPRKRIVWEKPEAIATAYPKQPCNYVSHGVLQPELRELEAAEVAADLRTIYVAATVEEAERCLDEFEAKWSEACLPIVKELIGLTTKN